jgi:hypothetical protein
MTTAHVQTENNKMPMQATEYKLLGIKHPGSPKHI